MSTPLFLDFETSHPASLLGQCDRELEAEENRVRKPTCDTVLPFEQLQKQIRKKLQCDRAFIVL